MNCPRCGGLLRADFSPVVGPVACCDACGVAQPLKEPPQQKRVKTEDFALTRPPEPVEKDLQATIVGYYRLRGYTVIQTGEARHQVTCYQCGAQFYPKGWQGNDEGCPDLIFSHTSWPVGCALLVELKRNPKAAIRPAQEELLSLGRVVLCWTFAQVQAAVKTFEERLGHG